MKFEFKPENLPSFTTHQLDQINRSLVEMLSSAIVVYGRFDELDGSFTCGLTGKSKDTHKALLINIEPLVKEECQHEPIRVDDITIEAYEPYCCHCNARLVAEWTEKKGTKY